MIATAIAAGHREQASSAKHTAPSGKFRAGRVFGARPQAGLELARGPQALLPGASGSRPRAALEAA
jgi:hypothetical protein